MKIDALLALPSGFSLERWFRTKGGYENAMVPCIDYGCRRPMLFPPRSGFGLDVPCRRTVGPHGNRFRHPGTARKGYRDQALRAPQRGWAMQYQVVQVTGPMAVNLQK